MTKFENCWGIQTRPPCGSLPFTTCSVTGPTSTPSPSFPIGSRYFRAKPFPVWIPQQFSNLVILHLPAYADGTDRVFRNVGISNSDAGQLPRRKHTTYRTRRKFEIKWMRTREYWINYCVTGSSNKCTSIKIYFHIRSTNTQTYFDLFRIILWEFLHQTRVYKIRINYQID